MERVNGTYISLTWQVLSGPHPITFQHSSPPDFTMVIYAPTERPASTTSSRPRTASYAPSARSHYSTERSPRQRTPPPASGYSASVAAARHPYPQHPQPVLVMRVTEIFEFKKRPDTRPNFPDDPPAPRSRTGSIKSSSTQPQARQLLLEAPPTPRSYRDRSPSRASSIKPSPSQSYPCLTPSSLGRLGGSTCGDRVGPWVGSSPSQTSHDRTDRTAATKR